MRSHVEFNAFHPDFLERFREVDDANQYAGTEAEYAGPWRVEALTSGLWGCYTLGETTPLLSFHDRSLALLAAAAVPGCGLPDRFTLGNRDEGMHPILDQSRTIGYLTHHDEALLKQMAALTVLPLNPDSLAHLLEACGPTSLKRAGKILMQRLQEQLTEDKADG